MKKKFSKYGIATCGKHDLFNIVKGCKIAFLRAIAYPKTWIDVDDMFRDSRPLFFAEVRYNISDIVQLAELRGVHMYRNISKSAPFGYGVIDETGAECSTIEITLK